MATKDEEYSFKILNTCDEVLNICFRTVEINKLTQNHGIDFRSMFQRNMSQ